MSADFTQAKLIFDLLQQTTSLAVVSEFLKTKNLHFSAPGWDFLFEKRIAPALEQHQLTNADLIELLRSVEESGRQHVFLYKCDAAIAAEILDEQRLQTVLKKLELEDLLVTPRTLDQPECPTIVDVRWTKANVILNLTIKEVEQRFNLKPTGTTVDGDIINKAYEKVPQRAVNVVRLQHDGTLEIRIAAHHNSSKYLADVERLWTHIELIVSRHGFTEISLSAAKTRLWNDRIELSEQIRYSDSTMKNDDGIILRAATGGEKSNLFSNAGAVSSMQNFLAHDDAHCDASNIWFIQKDGGPSRDIHVNLSGEINEFAVTANCSKSDYEYVLSQLKTLNR